MPNRKQPETRIVRQQHINIRRAVPGVCVCVRVVSLVVGLVGIHIYLFEVLCLHCFDDRLVPSRIHLCICLFVNLIDLLFARRLSPARLYVRAAHKGGPAECCWRLVVVGWGEVARQHYLMGFGFICKKGLQHETHTNIRLTWELCGFYFDFFVVVFVVGVSVFVCSFVRTPHAMIWMVNNWFGGI